MTFLIKVIDLPDGPERNDPNDWLGWLVECDVNARDGFGTIKMTRDVKEAKRFDSADHAIAYYRRQSEIKPLRGDGRPNRPCTAFSVEICPVEDSASRDHPADDQLNRAW